MRRDVAQNPNYDRRYKNRGSKDRRVFGFTADCTHWWNVTNKAMRGGRRF